MSIQENFHNKLKKQRQLKDFLLCPLSTAHCFLCSIKSFLQFAIYCSPLIVEDKIFCWFELHYNYQENRRYPVSQSSVRMSMLCHLDGKDNSYQLVPVFYFMMFTLSKQVTQSSVSLLFCIGYIDQTSGHYTVKSIGIQLQILCTVAETYWLPSKAGFKRTLEHFGNRRDTQRNYFLVKDKRDMTLKLA